MSHVILSLVKPCQTLILGVLKVVWVCDGVDVDVGQLFRVIFRLTYDIFLIIVAFQQGLVNG